MLQFQSMEKRTILFDIDRTILDTEKMIKRFDELILDVLGSSNYIDYKNAESDYFKTLPNERRFNVSDYSEFLSARFKPNTEKLIFNIFYSDKNRHIFSDCVFMEALEILNKLNNYNLGIYSEGTAQFQNHKFKSLKLDKYFAKELVFIVDVKDTNEVVEKLPKNAIIIDDKEMVCEFLVNNKIRAIWINRKDKRKSDKFETIYSLLDLPAIL